MRFTVSDCCLNRRVAFLIYVDLDSVPGTFHTPYSAYRRIQGMLNQSGVRLYAPVLIFSSVDQTDEAFRRRACYILMVDLDPIPGQFHSTESAQNAIRNVLQRIDHYNPVVSLAPASIQPSNIHQGM